jgi:RNA polymerase sigma factor (sigma-70 family)
MDAVITWFERPMEQESARLARGLRDGAPEIIDALIEIYQHRLLRYLMSLTGNRAMAEDLFQETWVRVLERGRQYRSQWKFDVWLFSIARHLVIDEFRRKRGLSLDELMDPAAGSGFEPSGHDPSPFDIWPRTSKANAWRESCRAFRQSIAKRWSCGFTTIWLWKISRRSSRFRFQL